MSPDTPYETGRRRGRITIGNTAGDVAPHIESQQDVKDFLEYMWGQRDAYDEFLTKELQPLIPVETPDNPELRRVLWAYCAILEPYVNMLKEKDRADDLEAVASLSVSITIKYAKDVLGDEAVKNVIHAFRDALEIESTTSEKKSGDSE